MATIYIDNRPYEIEAGQNLLHACLTLGFDVPYFCWHPALHSVGACRQCAVKLFKDEKDEHGSIVMACMTPADDGTRISIDDPEAREFRASVIEWLMVNHPHDCPVCDEGGECHLQDMTVMTGHNYREYRFEKRTHRNQDLGPFINHEMNRCIQCYRCVRFYQNYAGGHDLNVFGCHDHVYFGRRQPGALESEFSGNLVEICPTGVFTDKTEKNHFARKWDLQTAPSVCMHCSLGCNTIAGERYGMLRRIRNRYHHEINGYFLCDRGRYGYEFVNSERRIRASLRRSGRTLQPASWEELQPQVADWLADGSRVVGIGSPRASLEANFALRALVGVERFCAGMSDDEHRLVTAALRMLQQGPARSPSLKDVSRSDAVLVLGEDVADTAPILALTLRQLIHGRAAKVAERVKLHRWNDAGMREVIQDEKEMLFIATPCSTRLDDAALETWRAAPDELVRLGTAVAAGLNPDAPPAKDLPSEAGALAEEIARALAADRPLVVTGTGCGSEALLQAAANIAWALCAQGRAAQLCFVLPECNSMGTALMGGRSLADVGDALQSGEADTLIILENDLYRRADAGIVDALFEAAEHVVVIDHLTTATSKRAELVLPAATFAEATGTVVNNEGRAQCFYQVFVPSGEVRESWRWLKEMMTAAGHTESSDWQHLDDIVAAMADALPVFEPVLQSAPTAEFRQTGSKIPRQPHRYSGRTAMRADISVHEPKPPEDEDSPLAFSMEGYDGRPPADLIPRFWAPGWNSVQSLNKFQSEIGGPLRGGDPGQRLIEPAPDAESSYFKEIAAERSMDGEWTLVAIYHVFGSEELSMASAGVSQRSPQPYVALNIEDAAELQVNDGEQVKVVREAGTHRLPVRLTPSLPRKVAGIPVGLPGRPVFKLPAAGRIIKEKDS
ncbi:MAG: NADH-quinone oxidoreductase subunit NuoG [Desulfobacterales bacterium]